MQRGFRKVAKMLDFFLESKHYYLYFSKQWWFFVKCVKRAYQQPYQTQNLDRANIIISQTNGALIDAMLGKVNSVIEIQKSSLKKSVTFEPLNKNFISELQFYQSLNMKKYTFSGG